MLAQPRFNSGYISDSGDDEVHALACPRCGGLYLRHCGVTIYERGEDDKLTKVTVVDWAALSVKTVESRRTKNPSSRRHGLAIRFYCETCHNGIEALELAIEQHKGATFMRWRETEAAKTVNSLIAGGDPPPEAA